MAKALIACLTAGLVWQFVLVIVLVGREQRSLRWPTLREALWLRSPRSPRSGRIGGRVWLVLIPLSVAFGVEALIPTLPHADNRDFGTFVGSHAGHAFLHGAWGYPRLSIEAVPERLDWDRCAQHPERGLRSPRPQARRLRKHRHGRGNACPCDAQPPGRLDGIAANWKSDRVQVLWAFGFAGLGVLRRSTSSLAGRDLPQRVAAHGRHPAYHGTSQATRGSRWQLI